MHARFRRISLAPLAPVALTLALAGCAGTSAGSAGRASGSARGKFLVVAGESSWGSIATQLAGSRVSVQSIVVDPSTDPHSYQPTAQDARTVAGAKMAIVNGIGYDQWMGQALAASPVSGRVVLSVGDLLGLKEGANPHQWYSPASVRRVIDRIVADYDRLDPADTAYFARRKQALLTQGFARYDQLRAEIRTRFAGVPVGYSESIFEPLGLDLGLKLVTPASFATAIAEGTDVTAQDKQTVERQARMREIKVWIYNSQNVTPDVQRVTSTVKTQHIPIATVTETLSPVGDDFQQWQSAQLQRLIYALARATGRSR